METNMIKLIWRRRFAILFFLTAVGFGYLCISTIVGYESAYLAAASEHTARRAEMDQQQVQIDLLIKKQVQNSNEIKKLHSDLETTQKELRDLKTELEKRKVKRR